MGDQAFRTAHALNGKLDEDRVQLNGTFVTAVTDEAAFLPAGASDLEELQSIQHMVILLLRKTIAFFKDNCYHSIGNSTKGHGSLCCWEKDRVTLMGWDLSFSLGYLSSIRKFFF